MAAISAQMQKIEDASRKKDEQTNQFILATREALEQKMEQHGSNREAYITDLKTKLKVQKLNGACAIVYVVVIFIHFFFKIFNRITLKTWKKPDKLWNNRLGKCEQPSKRN